MPAAPTDSTRLALTAKGVLSTHVADQSFDSDPFRLRVDSNGTVTRLAGRAQVASTSGEELDVRIDIRKSLLWSFGTVSVRNAVTGDRAEGVLFFAPNLTATSIGDQQRVEVSASFFAAAGGRIAPTSVDLTLEQ